jgi:hypothetical protein
MCRSSRANVISMRSLDVILCSLVILLSSCDLGDPLRQVLLRAAQGYELGDEAGRKSGVSA